MQLIFVVLPVKVISHWFMKKEDIRNFYQSTAFSRVKWEKMNRFYHKSLEKYISSIIPEGKSVLEVGCGNGNLLNSTHPSYGVGIDFAPEFIETAKTRYPNLIFKVDDVVSS